MAATQYRLMASEDGRGYEATGFVGLAESIGGYEWLRGLADDLAEQGVYARVVKHWTHWGQPQRRTLYQVGPQR